MKIKVKYKFDFDRARMLQSLLSGRVIEEDCFQFPPKTICGVDASYKGDIAVGAAVSLDFSSMSVVEKSIVTCNVNFPYVPGFFAFRELRPLIMAIRGLSHMPSVIIVDAHGRAHPRGFGLACHLGLILNVPTIGVAKKLLCGIILLDEPFRRNVFPVVVNNEIVGAMIKAHDKPLFVSIGHKISLETAVNVILHCINSHEAPIPIVMAHKACRRYLSGVLT